MKIFLSEKIKQFRLKQNLHNHELLIYTQRKHASVFQCEVCGREWINSKLYQAMYIDPEAYGSFTTVCCEECAKFWKSGENKMLEV